MLNKIKIIKNSILKMEENQNNNEEFDPDNINDLVPSLLGKTEECSKNLSDRVKINGIFSEFDAYIHQNFQKFIQMSQQRYKSIKSGNRLEKKLLSQRQEYADISEQILNNYFYNNNEIEKESKKLLKKMNKNQNNKEISKLRKNIIQRTKGFTSKEVVKRDKLASAALERRRLAEIDRQAHRIYRRDLIYRPKSMKQKIESRNNMPIILNQEVKIKNDVDEYLKKKKFFDELMENDCKNLNENILDYKDFVKDVERVQVNKDENVVLPGTKKENYGHSFTFLTDGIKLLSYKEEQKVDVKVKHKEEPKIDIFKLMRFTKRGNKKWFKEELKKKSRQRLSAMYRTTNRKNMSKITHPPSSKIKYETNYNNDNDNNMDINEVDNGNDIIDFSNFDKMKKTNAFSNFKNTIKTIKNEAEKSYYLNDNFSKKRKAMNNLFNDDFLPKIDDYEKEINNRIESKKKLIPKEEADVEKNENEESKKKKDKNKELTQHYLVSFAKKKLTMTKEDFLLEQSKKKEKNVLQETKKYLKEIREVQKKVNKGDAINKCIGIFNEYLTHHNQLMKKKNLIEATKKPVKKIVNKNLIEQQNKKEEERKKKAEEERVNYLELLDKMRENLEKEDEDEDVKLNFQYKLCKGLVHETDLSENAYGDYLELMEIAKNRKSKGEYDYNNLVETSNNKKESSAYNKLLNNVAQMKTYVDSSGKIAIKDSQPTFSFGKKLMESVRLVSNK